MSGHSRHLLASLLRDVERARTDLRGARALERPEIARVAQEQLVHALTFYTEALASMSLPVPYVLRDELRIHRDTLFTP